MTVRQNLSVVDVIGIVLIVLGILMTVLDFLAARGPAAATQSFTKIAPRAATSCHGVRHPDPGLRAAYQLSGPDATPAQMRHLGDGAICL